MDFHISHCCCTKKLFNNSNPHKESHREVTPPTPPTHTSHHNKNKFDDRTRPSTGSTSSMMSTFNPYQTSYKHEFYRKDGEEDYDARPDSHIKLNSSPLRQDTTYREEFFKKLTTPNECMWSGGNNPHPSKAFMLWKYPTKGSVDSASSRPNIPNETYSRVLRSKTKSIYQMDFKGLPPGHMPSDLKNVILENDWKNRVPYTLDSSARISYQQPNQPSTLTNNTTRFGQSGRDRHRPLIGIAPNASQRKPTVKSATTYDRHYNGLAPQVEYSAKVHFPTHAKTVVRGKGPAELSALYEDIKRKHFPKHARGMCLPELNGYSSQPPVPEPDSGVPRVASPEGGLVPLPPAFDTDTYVPELIPLPFNDV